jgi:hypothetical protein
MVAELEVDVRTHGLRRLRLPKGSFRFCVSQVEASNSISVVYMGG